MLDRLSLRTRLVLGVIVLAAVGLAVANVVTYTSLRSFLFDRTDAALARSSERLAHSVFDHGECAGRGGRPPPGSVSGDYIEARDASGTTVCGVQVAPPDGSAPPPPDLPSNLEVPADGDGGRAFTVGSDGGSERYRVHLAVDPGSGGMLIVARPIADIDATLRRLLLIELLVTALVLAALAALGLWVVRLGLRPLDAIGATASAIASGNLAQRIERAEPRTEVGRLGLALNGMLARIEDSFHAQQASERRLRRFVADASHELRTPLAAVRAYAELFRRGADRRPDDLERAMAGISRESERMTLLVEDLLLLARLDEGRPLARDRVELDEVVTEAVDTAATLDPERPLALETEPVTVVGDRERLRQVVDNLLANVRAHTPPGTPARVRLGRDGDVVRVEVTDDGPGLASGEATRVFERFYRADESRARATGGVGLGLSVVAAVAAAHGGTAAAASTPGHGATFTVTLPIAPSQNGEAPAGDETLAGAAKAADG